MTSKREIKDLRLGVTDSSVGSNSESELGELGLVHNQNVGVKFGRRASRAGGTDSKCRFKFRRRASKGIGFFEPEVCNRILSWRLGLKLPQRLEVN